MESPYPLKAARPLVDRRRSRVRAPGCRKRPSASIPGMDFESVIYRFDNAKISSLDDYLDGSALEAIRNPR
jgi:hypothetical protein